jgi:hypothetical protein
MAQGNIKIFLNEFGNARLGDNGKRKFSFLNNRYNETMRIGCFSLLDVNGDADE